MKTALVDADIFAYKWSSASEEKFDWGDTGGVVYSVQDAEAAQAKLDADLDQLADRLKVDEMIICLSDPTRNYFRKALYPGYKASRTGRKPEHLEALKTYMTEKYRTYRRAGLEADDCMGILATHPELVPGKKVIVSTDKDMAQIPGWLFNPDKDKAPRKIDEHAGMMLHMTQTMTGDPVDEYPGCPGIGPKKAAAWLNGIGLHGMTPWECVVACYKSRGLTEDDALLQARLARILQWQDYDYVKKEVKLWVPPQS